GARAFARRRHPPVALGKSPGSTLCVHSFNLDNSLATKGEMTVSITRYTTIHIMIDSPLTLHP
ncbi:hypothetical protein, partial [Paenibacillus hubeiensis]|uniref:hypothetical protein n=1 Tax=Paenibacillus hubeiensis TaxID=3077330 RepID=UPI0031BB5B2E